MYFLNHLNLYGSNVTVSKPLTFQTLESARDELTKIIYREIDFSLIPPFGSGMPKFIFCEDKVINIDETEHPYGTVVIDNMNHNRKKIWYISSDEDKSDCRQIKSHIRYPAIVNVIFNNPATIVFWDDGTKTVVKCQNGDVYSKETGLAMAMLKRYMGNDNTYNKEINAWLDENE